MKKKLLLLLCFTLIIHIVSFAGIFDIFKKKKSDDAIAIENGKLKVSMMIADNASYPYKDDWVVMSEIERAANVELDLMLVPDTYSDYEAKRQIVFNSGKIPDIVYSKTQANTEDVINGLLLPISDYLDEMPNFKKFIETYDYSLDLETLKESDGKIYTLPVKADTRRMRTHQWLVRVDIFEKHNISIPKTLDDLYEAGLKLKELYPNESPIINRFGGDNIMGLIASGFGTLSGWALTTNGHIYDTETDEWVYAPTTNEYKEFLQYMNKLLETGVLDTEFNSLDSSAYEQRVVQGKTFILGDWVGNQVRYNLEGRKRNPDFNVQPIFPIQGPSGDYCLERGAMFEQFWVLPATLKNKKNFKEILAFIDWFYSEEASIITTFGAENVSYITKGEKLKYKDETKNQEKEFGVLNNSLNVRRHPDFFEAMNGEEIAKLFDEISEKEAVLPQDPKIRYNEDEVEKLKLLVPPLNDYKRSMEESFIYGKIPFSDWDAFVEGARQKGANKVGAVINNAWKKQKN